MKTLYLLWDIPAVKVLWFAVTFVPFLLAMMLLPESLTSRWFPRGDPELECDYDLF